MIGFIGRRCPPSGGYMSRLHPPVYQAGRNRVGEQSADDAPRLQTRDGSIVQPQVAEHVFPIAAG